MERKTKDKARENIKEENPESNEGEQPSEYWGVVRSFTDIEIKEIER